jgi:type II secretory pathway component PulK
MNQLKVFVDFHNADTQGRLRLNCIGTVEDLGRQQIVLREGLPLTLYSEELEVKGVVQYSPDEHVWVAVIDWGAVQDVGEPPRPSEDSTHQQRHIA